MKSARTLFLVSVLLASFVFPVASTGLSKSCNEVDTVTETQSWSDYFQSLHENAVFFFKIRPAYSHYVSPSAASGQSFMRRLFSAKAWLDAKGWASFIKAAGTDYAAPIFKSFTPVPLPDTWFRGKTHKSFYELAKDPNYKPSAKEIEALKSIPGAYEYFSRYQAFISKRPWLAKTKRSLWVTSILARWLIFAGVVALVAAENESGVISVDEFLKKPVESEDGKHEIQLINESVPFPHLALRMGDSVFSYGQTHLTETPVYQYLNSLKTREAIERELEESGEDQPRAQPEKKGSSASITTPMARSAFAIANATGLADEPRSVHVATLYVTKDEYYEIKKSLRSHVANKYANTTFVNDCATMIARVIEEKTNFYFSPIVDASPSQMIMLLAMKKAAGHSRVGDITLVTVDGHEHKAWHLSRNAAISMLEAQVFLKFFFLNQIHRAGLEIYHDKESIQYLEEEFKAEMEQLKKEIAALVDDRNEVKELKSRISRYEELNLDYERMMSVGQTMNQSVDRVMLPLIENETKAAATGLNDPAEQVIIAAREERLKYIHASLKERINSKLESMRNEL